MIRQIPTGSPLLIEVLCVKTGDRADVRATCTADTPSGMCIGVWSSVHPERVDEWVALLIGFHHVLCRAVFDA